MVLFVKMYHVSYHIRGDLSKVCKYNCSRINVFTVCQCLNLLQVCDVACITVRATPITAPVPDTHKGL
jgi:hypothetical protein